MRKYYHAYIGDGNKVHYLLDLSKKELKKNILIKIAQKEDLRINEIIPYSNIKHIKVYETDKDRNSVLKKHMKSYTVDVSQDKEPFEATEFQTEIRQYATDVTEQFARYLDHNTISIKCQKIVDGNLAKIIGGALLFALGYIVNLDIVKNKATALISQLIHFFE